MRTVTQLATRSILAAALVTGFTSVAHASAIPIGFVSWDVNFPANAGQFDIINETGPNSAPPDFPVTSTVNLSSLSLHVDFADGSSHNYGSSYFSLSSDGISWDGSPIPIGGSNPLPLDATLTGSFSPLSLTLSDGTTPTILSTFSATVTDPTGGPLADGDFAIIDATPGGSAPVPEPGTLTLLGSGLAMLVRRRRDLQGWARKHVSGSIGVFAVLALLVPSSSWAAVSLNSWTAPDNGVAGVNNVNINGSGFPSGTITPGNVMVTFATSCGGAAVVTVPANSVKTILGGVKRVNVSIPAGLPTGTYFVSVNDSAAGDADFASSNCSEVNVTHTNPTLAACVPTSSLGLLATGSGATGASVAYVPNGYWSGGSTGVRVAPIEGGGSPSFVSTPSVVNSCSANPATGQVTCTGNNTNVFLLNGTTLSTTLTSGSNGSASFSGGTCMNCGVATDALNNQAVIAMGHTGGDAIQFLDLNTNTFGAPFILTHEVSEDVSIDPTRGLVLSPNENGFYDLIQFGGGTLTEYLHSTPVTDEWDSAAEDCTTGIALAVGEFTSNVYLADLTQATFNSGAHSWTAPEKVVTLNGTFAAGASAVSVAPGTSHQAIVTGEFGGNSFAILQLPSTSGSGTPGVVDYAYVSAVPSLPNPSGGFFGTPNAGFDPHTTTAYTSTVDGKAYAVSVSWSGSSPSFLVIYDMAAILAAPRNPGTNTVTSAGVANLVATGAIRGVPIS